MRKFLKILRYIVFSILILIFLFAIAIQTSPVQNWLVHNVTERLSKDLGTEVSVKKVSFSFLDKMNLEKFLIRDKKKDTLVYAGALNVRITDWFIFKTKADLKYIGLTDATIQLNRKDSVWNYQFLIDYFSSPSSSSPKKKSSLKIDLKKLDFKNVSFISKDDWIGETMIFKIGSLVLNADSINFDKKIIRVNNINLVNPVFVISEYDGLRPAPLHKKIDSTSSIKLNPGGLDLKVAQINMSNGTISVISDNDKPLPYFDGAHIHITKLSGRLTNTQLIKDTLKSEVNISARERSGFELKRLVANYKFTPHIMEFSNFDLQTNKSRIGNYYAMKFKSFDYDFNRYINRVTMVGRLRNSKVHTDDIAFFAPELKSWKNELTVNGDYLGTVDNFTVNQLLAKNSGSTFISGQFSMKGLPYIDNTFINFSNGIIKTNYNEAAVYLPVAKTVKMPNLSALGNIFFRGSYKGTLLNFSTQGTISSNLGVVTADINMQFPKNKKKDITYNGTITTKNFNIGKFLMTDKLGNVDFVGKISGTNFLLDKIKTTLDGNISSLQFNNYTYSNISINGTIQKKYFNGEFDISDSNFDARSHVEVDLSKPIPAFNILGDIGILNLKPINFYKSNLSVTALIDMNFTASNIDNFSGFAKLLNVNVKNDKQNLSFDSLSITSGFESNRKFLQISGNDFNSSVTGDFKIMDLPTNFRFFLNKYYPAYFQAPDTTLTKQDFSFNITTNNVEPYLQILDSNLRGFNYAALSGNVNTKNNIFNFALNLPDAHYRKYAVKDAVINGTSNLDTLKLNGNISSVQVSDSLNFPNSQFNIVSSRNYSNISLKTSANNTLNEADLNADVYALNDKGLKIHFNPSSFILNNKPWHLEKEGEILITKNEVSAQNVKFSQGFQEINVTTENADNSSKNNLLVKLKNVVLGDITNLFFKDPKLEGLINGEVHLHNFFGKFSVETNLKAEQFRMNNDSVGIVNIQSNYNNETGYVSFGVTSPNKSYDFSADGYYNVKDSTHTPLNTTWHLNHTKVSLLQNYLSDIFNNIDGFANGELTVSGNPKTPDIIGNVKLEKAKLQVDYTKVSYTIDSANISFKEDGIDFGEFKVKDTLNNTGTLSGKLYEKGFKNMNFDFKLSTNKLLLINTKATDNPLFYGHAIGKADMSFKGPMSNCKLTIIGKVNDTSHMYIPMSDSKENGQADFIVFKQYGTEIKEDSTDNNNLNLLVDLDVEADNRTTVEVILDPLTGDILKANGRGRLKIKAGTTEPFTMVGKYNIDNGSYNFNFQSLIRKPFILRPDAGNYIEWTGDPMNANIHIEAQYTAENVNLSDLVGNKFSTSNSGNSISLYRGPVYVIAILTDKLSKPTINFKFDFPQGSSLKSDPDFTQFISNIEHDYTEVIKQVSYLLVFNSFAPSGNNFGGANNNALNISTIGSNTISQLVTRFMNATVAKALADAFHDKRLQFDIGASAYSSTNLVSGLNGASGTSNAGIDRTRFNLKVGYKLFNDKVIVSFGGDIDIGLSGASNIPTQWLPDLTVEIVLSADNKLRGMIFSKNSLDAAASTAAGGSNTFGKRTRQGLGISYKKDFEKLFGRKQDEIEIKSASKKE